MSAARSGTRALRSLEALLGVTSVLRGEHDFENVLSTIVRTVAEALEFRTVVLHLYRPAFDDFCVTTVHGSSDVRAALLGSTYGWADWEPLLTKQFRHRGAYLILHGAFERSLDTGDPYVPQIAASDDPPRDWHPEAELFVPFDDSDGKVLGILAVSEPSSGRRPTSAELDLLVALAGHAAVAIEAAQQAARRARDRAALEQLLKVSAMLSIAESPATMLDAVCGGIQTALGFQRVVLDLVDAPGRRLETHAGAGWDRGPASDPEPLGLDVVRRLLDPQLESAGCFLVAGDRTLLRAGRDPMRRASHGRGPHAWSHHLLAVPLCDPLGDVVGVIWADEPDDRLLPSTERLQMLRLFADQATTALLQARQLEQMRFLANHDPLTNLLNRRAFERTLESEIARARRYGSSLALLVFDFDRLKVLNDTHGHAAGDEALRQVGTTLRHALRGGDHAFRIGGDEFAVVLPEATADDARRVARRIAGALPTLATAGGWKPSMSCGVAVLLDDGDAAELLRAADRAMYEEKRRSGPPAEPAGR